MMLLRVSLCAYEVQGHIRLIADNPTVVWHRRDIEGFATAQLDNLPIVEGSGGDTAKD
jgi:hypothetical protein